MGVPVVVFGEEARSLHREHSIRLAVAWRQDFETLERTIVDLRARFGSSVVLRAKVRKGKHVGRV